MISSSFSYGMSALSTGACPNLLGKSERGGASGKSAQKNLQTKLAIHGLRGEK